MEQLSKTDRNPAQESEYKQLLQQAGIPYYQGGNLSTTAQFRGFAGGAQFGAGGAGGAFDPIAEAEKLRQFNVKANQPYISSLQSSIPETSARFATQRSQIEGQREPLKQRYQNIIAELKGGQSAELSRAGERTSREFGYRGIPASSTLFTDELIRGETPIRDRYGRQITGAGLEQEEGLQGLTNLQSNLVGEETESLRSTQNLIGQAQAGEPTSALAMAMQILGMRQSASESSANRASQEELARQQLGLSERELGLKETASKQPNTEIVNIGGRSKLINSITGAVIQDLGVAGSPSTGTASERASASSLEALRRMVGAGVPFYDLRPLFGNQLPEWQIREEYNKASPLVKRYGQSKEKPLTSEKPQDITDEEAAKVFGLDVNTYRAYKDAGIL